MIVIRGDLMFDDYEYLCSQTYFNEDNFNDRELTAESDEIITLNQAIELIKKSVENEKEDEQFYNLLLQQASSLETKEIIKSIRDDEKKHNQILRKLYYEFTGQILPNDTFLNKTNNYTTFNENLKKAMFGELNAVKKYRKILGTMPSGNSYTLLMAIVLDELRHANLYNFLIHEYNQS